MEALTTQQMGISGTISFTPLTFYFIQCLVCGGHVVQHIAHAWEACAVVLHKMVTVQNEGQSVMAFAKEQERL